jgi:hypothetical protein
MKSKGPTPLSCLSERQSLARRLLLPVSKDTLAPGYTWPSKE